MSKAYLTDTIRSPINTKNQDQDGQTVLSENVEKQLAERLISITKSLQSGILHGHFGLETDCEKLATLDRQEKI